MGFPKSKEDGVQRISTSIYVTNFPDSVGAKELWNACKQYGYVVDSFIPNKRSKAGKRFGFVRFIKRPEGVNSNKASKKGFNPRVSTKGVNQDTVHNNKFMSYAYAVKEGSNENGGIECEPVMVLDDSCVNNQDYSCCLNGKIKDFEAITNLKAVLENEGFNDFSLRYLGGMWVMIVFKTVEVKNKFSLCAGVISWFSQLIQTSKDFTIDGRVMWVNVEGVPLKVWNENTFKRIAAKWGSLLSMENAEEDNLHSKRLCVYTKGMKEIHESFKINYQSKSYWVRAREITGWNSDFEVISDDSSASEDDYSVGDIQEDSKGSESEDELRDGEVKEMQGENEFSVVQDTIFEVSNPSSRAEMDNKDINECQSEDPFNIYSLFNKEKRNEKKESNSKESFKYPPGYTPCETSEEQPKKIDGMEPASSGFSRKNEMPKMGGSLLTVMEELIKVGQTMGYNMEGCTKNVEEIIESQGVDGVFR
ncbi:DIE2/ALG10 family protein [Tanacetum coccineum]